MSDWVHGVLQAIFGSLLYELLLATAVAALMTWLKSKQSRWATPLLYGVSAFAAVLLISYVLVGRGLLSKEQPETTPENVETNIRSWADNLGLGVAKQESGADNYFLYLIALHSGRVVYVGRTKSRPNYIQFQSNVTVSKEHQELLSKLSEERRNMVIQETLLELARSRIGYEIPGPKFTVVMLTKSVPITSGLTEATFGGYLDEMDSAMALSIEAIVLSIERNSPSH
jgi:hypothetical protein